MVDQSGFTVEIKVKFMSLMPLMDKRSASWK